MDIKLPSIERKCWFYIYIGKYVCVLNFYWGIRGFYASYEHFKYYYVTNDRCKSLLMIKQRPQKLSSLIPSCNHQTWLHYKILGGKTVKRTSKSINKQRRYEDLNVPWVSEWYIKGVGLWHLCNYREVELWMS